MPKKKSPAEQREGLATKAKTEPAPEQNLIAKADTAPTVGKAGLVLNTLAQMETMAKYILDSGLAPKEMQTPAKIIVAMQKGFEVGLPMMQSVQNIAVINGRPTMWGDALLALVESSGKLEVRSQELKGVGDGMTAMFESRRKGRPGILRTEFSVGDAKRAGLWGKSGPWTNYPKRMLMNRARAFNLRDNFPDVLSGLHDREEVLDYIPVGAEVDAGTSGVEALAQRIAPKEKDDLPEASVADLEKAEAPEKLYGPGANDDTIKPADPDEAGLGALPETVPDSVLDEFDTMNPEELDGLWQLARETGGAVTEENFIEGLRGLGPEDMALQMETRIKKNAAAQGE